MSQLSAQSIKSLCTEPYNHPHAVKIDGKSVPMIVPFVETKQVVNGKSFGLSACSYDVRIAHDLVLHPGESALAHTIEDFFMPHDVVGYVCDKSTYARLFVTAFNTLIDAGFCGNLTLELSNLGKDDVRISAGDPICQMVFHWLDQPTDRPYSGKYNHQSKGAHGPRFEKDDGSYV